MLLSRINSGFFFFPFYCRVFFFVDKVSENFFFLNSKKIMKSAMGIPSIEFDPLWPLYKYP